MERPAHEDVLVAGDEIGGDDAERDLELLEGASRAGRGDDVAQPVVGDEVVVAAQEVPRPAQCVAGEHVLTTQPEPDALEPVDALDRGVGGDHGAVQRSHRGADDDVGVDGHARARARSIPTCPTPWLPPPESTKAVTGRSRARAARSIPAIRPRPLRSSSLPSPTIVRVGHADRRREAARSARRFVSAEKALGMLPTAPDPGGGKGASAVTEFYRQYLAVAVLIGAALLMVGAMLGAGRLASPEPTAGREVHHLRGRAPIRSAAGASRTSATTCTRCSSSSSTSRPSSSSRGR